MKRREEGVAMKRQRRAVWRQCVWALVVASCTWLGQTCAWAQTADVPAASSIPPSWMRYAQLASTQFQTSLEADNDASAQLHQYLEDRVVNATADAPPPAIVVRAWIGERGAVSRIQFESLGDERADAALRDLLMAHPLPEPPPPDMLQPLRVRLRLVANPEAARGASSAAR